MHQETNNSPFIPELLAPAGNLEKLKIAILYGANAVYLGGLKFGLRSAADNFTNEELIEGVQFAHDHNAQVYVVLNSFLHDKDLEELPEFVEFLDSIHVDAVIVSDLGVIQTVKKYSKIPVHLSTQASCLNIEAAKLWKKIGVSRIVVGRELTVKEAGELKRAADIEIEMFIHGSMCMAYSGNCVISNFTQGRDSNRGGCAHSCRFEYSLDFDSEDNKNIEAYFMSSKDLAGIQVLPEFIDEKIDSLKVEGRMKSNLYAGTISKVYSEALNHYSKEGKFSVDELKYWEEELQKVTHRAYSEGSLQNKAGVETIFNERETSDSEYVTIGTVISVKSNEYIVIEVKNAFELNDELEILPFDCQASAFKAEFIRDLSDDNITRTNPSTLVKIPFVAGAEQFNLIRKQVLLC